MLLDALKRLAIQASVILMVLASCAGIIAVLDGADTAFDLLHLTIHDMLGIWVWVFGWGLERFVSHNAMTFVNDLTHVLEPGHSTALLVGRIERSVSHRRAVVLTLPITAFGLLLTFAYGVPLDGIASILIVLGVASIYYVGAFLLWHFLGVIHGFNAIHANMDAVRFRTLVSPLHLENALDYLSLTTLIGVAGIYSGFRGTLTAGFVFPQETMRTFLVAPLVLFLPATLFYNFHPRYVLRRLVQHRVFEAMNKLGSAGVEDARTMILEIKELGLTSAQVLPFIDYKTLPSYLISVLFVVSLAYHNDRAVKAFIDYLFGFRQ